MTLGVDDPGLCVDEGADVCVPPEFWLGVGDVELEGVGVAVAAGVGPGVGICAGGGCCGSSVGDSSAGGWSWQYALRGINAIEQRRIPTKITTSNLLFIIYSSFPFRVHAKLTFSNRQPPKAA